MTETITTEKRRVGRPKGTPRTGGRKPGTPNRTSMVTRNFIVKNGAPVRVLCQIAAGRKMTAAASPGSEKRESAYPTLDQRLRAAEILARKIVPDMKSVEASGPDGGDLIIRVVRFGNDAS